MGSGGWLGLESSGEPLPPQLQPKNSSKRLPTHSEGKFGTFLKEKFHFLLNCLGEYLRVFGVWGLAGSGELWGTLATPTSAQEFFEKIAYPLRGKFCIFLKEKIHFLLTCLGEYFERVLVGCSPGLETFVCSKKPAQRRPLQAMAGKWRILAAEARIHPCQPLIPNLTFLIQEFWPDA